MWSGVRRIPNWQPAKDAAKKIAFAEDRAIFDGYREANIQGIREGTSNPIKALPADVRDYPDAVAQALSQLRLVGVNGPYSVVLGADEYTELAETRDHGYPVLEHVKRIVDGDIIWAPAIGGAFVLTMRGGDFELNIGQDISIGYLSHTDAVVRLYLQETCTFRVLTSEASVALSPSTKLLLDKLLALARFNHHLLVLSNAVGGACSEKSRLRPSFVAASSSAAWVKKNWCFGLEFV